MNQFTVIHVIWMIHNDEMIYDDKYNDNSYDS